MTDDHRDKIKNSNILNALIEHVEGKREMSATQVSAGLGLLRKCLPDLTAAENKTEVTVSYVAELPSVAASTDEWQKQHAPTALQ